MAVPLLVPLPRSWRLVVGGAAICTWVVVGLSVAASLASRSHSEAMSPGAALVFAVFALVLWVRARTDREAPRRWMRVVLAAALVLPLWSVLGGDSQIRMSPVTAWTSFAGGLAILLRRRDGTAWFVGMCGGIAGLGLVVVMGYAFETPLFFNAGFVPVSLPSGLGFIALGVGGVAASGPGAPILSLFAGDSVRARLLRAFPPLAALLTAGTRLLSTLLYARSPFNPALTAAALMVASVAVMGVVVAAVSRRISGEIDASEQKARDALAAQLRAEAVQRGLQLSRMAALGRLATGVAHEVNNPLAIILANLSYLDRHLRGLPVPPEEGQELREVLGEMRQGADRVRGIVHELAACGGDDGAGAEDTDLRDAVSEALDALGKGLPGHVRLTRAVDTSATVRCDPALLRRVVGTLVRNAAAAIDAGAPARDVRVRTYRGPGEAVVEVVDTGRGIPPDRLARIFDPFQELKTHGQSGKGLGLASCQALVCALGGRIDVESTVNQGTRFAVHLPAVEQAFPA